MALPPDAPPADLPHRKKRKLKDRLPPRTLAAFYLVQFLGLRTVAMLFDCFPINANLRTARLMGTLWFRLSRKHRERTCEHIRISFPELVEPAVHAMARESMVHLTQFALEMFTAPRLITSTTWHRYVRLEQLQEPVRLLLAGRPLVMLTGHYGSWELLGFTLASLGFPMFAVMRPLDNPYLNEWLERVRAARGLQLLHKKGVSERAEELLGSGDHVVAFIADQDAGKKGVFVPFFGRPASTYKSIALLAMRYNAPVVVGYARRVRRDRFQYEIGVNRIIHPQEWEQAADPMRYVTEQYTAAIEEFVRRDPSQYLWIHRRWKHQPPVRTRPSRAVGGPDMLMRLRYSMV